MAKIITIDWYTKFLVPDSKLAAYNKANSLTKELAAAKAQIDLLVEKGINGAFCPQETDKVQVSTTLDKELPL